MTQGQGVLARPIAAPERLHKSEGYTAQALRRLRRNRSALIGLGIVLLLVVASLLAPWIAPHDPIRQNSRDAYQLPSARYWLGTDNLGRDLFSRILWGGQISLTVGIISVGIGLLFGVPAGLLAGFYGGKVDWTISRLVDLMLAFPEILLALAIVAILGPSLQNVMIAVGISAIPRYIRIVRGSTLAVRNMLYVESARVIGAGDRRILMRHILPNVLAPVIVLATLGVASAILAGASLSYLGLGAQPPTPEWGKMLADGRNFLRQYPWITTVPGLAIMLTVLAINLFGDGLRDALDPRLKV